MSIIEKFKKYFSEIDFSKESVLREIYASDIVFIDPIHEIQGIENLILYFRKLNSNLVHGSFQFESEDICKNKVYLTWTLTLKLKRPAKTVRARGISVLLIDRKIIAQRDFFDAGELFYENIPFLGRLNRVLKNSLSIK